jgi:hypothetical protein
MDKKESKLHQSRRPPEGLSEAEMAKHPSWRRYTKSYKARRSYVRDLWTYWGALIIFMPLTLQIFCLASLAFLSLSILDAEGRTD